MDKSPSDVKPIVLFVPGGVMPANLSYAPLLNAIGNRVQAVVKDLEVYASEAPPPNYSLEMEVEGIRRSADAAGVDRFHLVGYSGGGACALAFTAKYPERLLSLALIEPAWIGILTPEDAEDWAEMKKAMTLPPDERMAAFMRWHMRPGVKPPSMLQPPGPPPPWMARRPAGLDALSQAFSAYRLDANRIRQFDRPVYYALGSLSTRFFERAAKTLTGLFPEITTEEYEGRSHFDPPHRAEPERFACALYELWACCEPAITTG